MQTSKGTNSLLPAGVLKAMTYGLPAVSLLFMSGWPAALQLSFFISTLFSTFQSSMIQWSPFRRLVKIAPLPANVQTTPVAEAAYNGRLNLGETAKRTLSVSGSSRTTKFVSSSQTGGILGMLERAKDNFQTMQKDVTKTVENYTGSSAAKDDKKIAEAYEKRRAAEDAKKLREDALARRARARARKRSQV